MPAEYGGRVSSVLDVRTRSGNTERIQAQGGLGLVSSRLAIDGPLLNRKTTFAIGGRASYSDWILKELKDLSVRNSRASFYDGQANIRHRFSDKDQLTFSSYLSADSFYLVEVYKGDGAKRELSLSGNLINGRSAASFVLPAKLQEGVYWVRVLIEGESHALSVPFYVFARPGEIEPEAQPPFQLTFSAKNNFLFASAQNEVFYELWPEPLQRDGRLLVRDEKGNIVADTLLAPTGKGSLQLLPEAGSILRAEVWLQDKQLISRRLPQVLPFAFDWRLRNTALDISCSSEDTLSAYSLQIVGPDGFMLQEDSIQNKELSFEHTSWPSGTYMIEFFAGDKPVLQEPFSLREEQPGLYVSSGKLRSNNQYQLHGRLEGIREPQQASWQLRVQSSRQAPELMVTENMQWLKAPEERKKSAYFLSRVEPPVSLDPGQLHGYVRDAAGSVVPGAFVSLSGNHLDRPYYAISDEAGRFSFDYLPLATEQSYLFAIDMEEKELLAAEVAGVEAPEPFPVLEIDSAGLSRARSYVRNHFLLQLLYGKKGKSLQEKSFIVPPLSVPAE